MQAQKATTQRRLAIEGNDQINYSNANWEKTKPANELPYLSSNKGLP